MKGACRTNLRSAFRALALPALLGLAAGTLNPGQAAAATVEAAEFVVAITDDDGNARSIEADIVPYLPGRACFGWQLRFADAPGVIQYREILKLPEAPAFWSGEGDSYSTHSYSADRTTATTEAFAAPDAEGWIYSSWCIAPGDPVGAHSIEVYIDDELVRRFDFEVKRPRGGD